MLLWICSENVFDRIEDSFIIITLTKLSVEENFFNLIISIFSEDLLLMS